jgi:hypothetical protein
LTSSAATGSALAGCARNTGDGPSADREQPESGDAVFETVVPAGSSAADIQSAIDDAAEAATPGDHAVVRGEPGGYEIDQTLTLRSNVYLHDFTLRVADGANVTAVETAGFEDLSGSGAWIVGNHDMPYNFGLENVHVDGNRENNSGTTVSSYDDHAIGGVALYGKLYRIVDTFVRATPGIGFYSECGGRGGQGDWRDSPESQLRNLQVRGCGGDGIRFRGPHDSHIETAYPHSNRGYGIVVEGKGVGDVPFSGGGIEIGEIHSYANNWRGETGEPDVDSVGQRYAASIVATRIDVDAEAAVFENNGCQVSHLVVHEGWNGGGARITGSSTMLGQVQLVGNQEKNQFDHAGLRVDAKNVQIAQANCQEWRGDGIVVDDNNVSIGSYDCGEVTGYGLKLGDTTQVSNCFVQATNIQGGEAALYYNGGSRNRVVWMGYVPEGRTVYAGEPPADSDRFLINATRPGWNSGRSHDAGTTSVADGGRIEHGLLGPPSRVSLTPATPGANPAHDPSGTDEEAFGVTIHDDGGSAVTDPVEIHWEATW